MTDTQSEVTPDVVSDAPQTLDDVTAGFTAQPEPAPVNNVQEFKPVQSQPNIDPYDEASINTWAANSQNQQAALQGEIQNLKDAASVRDQAESQKIIDADIKSAVTKITESVEGIDPLMAELYLEKRAAEHPGFKSAWDNRAKDPTKYNQALDAISGELDGKFQRVDTTIAANHRAAKQSQQSNNAPSAPKGNSMEAQLAGATSDAQRNYLWNQIKNGG